MKMTTEKKIPECHFNVYESILEQGTLNIVANILEGKYKDFHFKFHLPQLDRNNDVKYHYIIIRNPRLYEVNAFDEVIESIITDYFDNKFQIWM